METETASDSGPLTKSTAASAPQLRISADKVNRLMDLVSELSLSVSETIRSPDLQGMDLAQFENSAHRLQLVVREVQTAAAELRLVPVADVFKRMRRLMRELERQTGKEVELQLVGEETEIDKFVVDRLFEPLVHLLRNSVDHGIEAPDVRIAAGKPRCGQIILSAAQVGGDVQITISDDGNGLNRERILKIARQRGFFGEREEPTDEEVWRVIFMPGFSTADTVTNISGRGVGMDVLNHTINELRGRISIRSRAGEGATFTLAIPLSLAFLDCLVMRIGESLYATPIDVVAEILQPSENQTTRISAEHGREVVRVRESIIPIRQLPDLYGMSRSSDAQESQVIVVFNTSRGRLGLPVDEMFDQQQVVMKPLVGHLQNIRAGIGCALLGTGDVAIVLDCEKLNDGCAS